MDAELEVQRTIKRVELTAFLCLLKKVIGQINVHVDNKRFRDGLWKGERKCTDPKAGDAELWIKKLGRAAQPDLERNIGGSEACQSAPHKEGQERCVAPLRSLSLKATRKRCDVG